MPGLIAPFASKPAAQAAHFESDAVKMSRAGGAATSLAFCAFPLPVGELKA
jgi:hypothetical protein